MLRAPTVVEVEVVVWGWSFGNFGNVTGDAVQPPETLPEWVARVLEHPLFPRPAVDMLDALYNGRPEVATGFLATDDGEILALDYDPVADKEEALYLLETVKPTGLDHGRFFAYELVTQPIDRSWLERPYPSLITTRRVLEVDNDHDEHVKVTSKLRIQAIRTAAVWRARLDDRRTRNDRVYPIGVSSVTIGGKPADFYRDGFELLVRLPVPLQANQAIDLEIVNEGDMALRYEGNAYWILGTSAWCPRGDRNGELAPFQITVRAPEGLEIFASGDEVSARSADGFSIVTRSLDRPVSFPVVVVGKYTVFSEARGGLTCRVATYGGAQKRPAERLINNFFAAATFYGALFGVPYPWDEVTIVERNAWGFGQAPAGIIFITKEAFDQISTPEARAASSAINDRFVHEIAHAWWGHVVGANSFDEQWLEESIADYSSAVCLTMMRGSGRKSDREFAEIMLEWRTQSANIDDDTSVFLANHLAGKDDDDFEERLGLLYAKGPMVLHALRLELQKQYGDEDRGDEAFFTVLRTLLSSFENRFCETRHLVGILNQVTGKDWSPWFELFVLGPGFPDLKD